MLINDNEKNTTVFYMLYTRLPYLKTLEFLIPLFLKIGGGGIM